MLCVCTYVMYVFCVCMYVDTLCMYFVYVCMYVCMYANPNFASILQFRLGFTSAFVPAVMTRLPSTASYFTLSYSIV